jgi:hypothetical protein
VVIMVLDAPECRRAGRERAGIALDAGRAHLAVTNGMASRRSSARDPAPVVPEAGFRAVCAAAPISARHGTGVGVLMQSTVRLPGGDACHAHARADAHARARPHRAPAPWFAGGASGCAMPTRGPQSAAHRHPRQPDRLRPAAYTRYLANVFRKTTTCSRPRCSSSTARMRTRRERRVKPRRQDAPPAFRRPAAPQGLKQSFPPDAIRCVGRTLAATTGNSQIRHPDVEQDALPAPP